MFGTPGVILHLCTIVDCSSYSLFFEIFAVSFAVSRLGRHLLGSVGCGTGTVQAATLLPQFDGSDEPAYKLWGFEVGSRMLAADAELASKVLHRLHLDTMPEGNHQDCIVLYSGFYLALGLEKPLLTSVEDLIERFEDCLSVLATCH